MENQTSGLLVYPINKEDINTIREAIENEGFHIESYNEEFNCFYLPEFEENYDNLETALNELLEPLNVSFRLEGIF